MRPCPLPLTCTSLKTILTSRCARARSPDTGSFVFSDVRLGSRGDSYYEYLSKQYLQTNRTEATYRDMHDEAMGGIKKHLLKKSAAKNFVYTSELLPSRNPMTGALCVPSLSFYVLGQPRRSV